MGKYKIIIKPTAIKDLERHKKIGKKSDLKKISSILSDLENHPFIGVGKPESLKYDLHGFWSRRINKKDRLIYKVREEAVTVFVVSAIGHYYDK